MTKNFVYWIIVESSSSNKTNNAIAVSMKNVSKIGKLLKNKIHKEKKNVLMNHKDQINRFISKDIVTRFYNQKGKIVNSINNDSEVIDAVKLLQDPAKYNKILSKN